MVKFIPQRIAERRDELKMSQEDLARKIVEQGKSLDSSRALVSRVEGGRSDTGVSKLVKIANALNVEDMNYFFEGAGQLRPVAEEKPVIEKVPKERIDKPSFEEVLQELSVGSSERRAVVVLESKKASSSVREILKDMKVELKGGQSAVIVVLDDLSRQQLSVVKSAFSLMQGVKAVVDVPGDNGHETKPDYIPMGERAPLL
jgi:transcriptional regulator with XRE-family HTH domain